MTSEKAPERIWFNGALISDHMHTSTVQFPGATSYVPEETVAAAYLDAAERAKVHTLGLDKTRADRLVSKIVERTPSDARAALAEAERKAWEAGRDAAKALIQKELDDYIDECGMYDSTTGVMEYPGTGEEWVQDQQERIDAIAALKKEPGA